MKCLPSCPPEVRRYWLVGGSRWSDIAMNLTKFVLPESSFQTRGDFLMSDYRRRPGGGKLVRSKSGSFFEANLGCFLFIFL